jgi:hypothetical protein
MEARRLRGGGGSPPTVLLSNSALLALGEGGRCLGLTVAMDGTWIAEAAALGMERATSCRWRAVTIGAAGRLLDCVGGKAVEDGGGGTENSPTCLWHKI